MDNICTSKKQDFILGLELILNNNVYFCCE